jgi:hybrid polyketide synthase/nonribosomal peptide synthetase ACE1
LSGDEDAVDEAEGLLKADGLFARKLQVDTAYHSAHMDACARAYLASLETCNIHPVQSPMETSPTWFSSVYEGQPMTASKLDNTYWVNNMCNTVLFSDALANAINEYSGFDLAIEVGPHPALKGPALSTLGTVPYTGLLSRGANDVEQLSMGLGNIWMQLGPEFVQLPAIESLLAGVKNQKVVSDLPLYPFDHNRTYWAGSRFANHFKYRKAIHAPNVLLGMPCTEATTPGEFQWRNILSPKDLPWLSGHQLQGQTVFAATGYLAMAIESIRVVALDFNTDVQIGLIQLGDIEISRAIAFQDDTDRVETIFSISSIRQSETEVTAEWASYSIQNGFFDPVLNCKGNIKTQLHMAQPNSLPLVRTNHFSLVTVEENEFYRNLSRVGYGYSSPFRGVSNIQRKSGFSTGTLTDQSGSSWNDNLVLHPGVCDSALQTLFAAWSHPGDTQLWSMHIPVSIAAVTLNPYFTAIGKGGKQINLQFESVLRSNHPSKVIGDIYLRSVGDSQGVLQIEGVALVPFSRATPKDDLPMFSALHYNVSLPDGPLAAAGETMSDYDVQLYKDIDRVAYWFAREVSVSIPAESRHDLLPHFQMYLTWCDRMVDMVSRNTHLKVSAACNADSRQDISRILAKYPDRDDVRFVEVVGDNLAAVIRAGTSMLEHMNKDGLLRAFYEENAICSGLTGRWLSRIVAQISYRYPNLHILEVGAGTGATTSAVFSAIGDAYSSYTFTDISAAFFPAAEERFVEQSSTMDFKIFNMEKSPTEQGFAEGTYDVIVAVNVLHVSADIEHTLSNVRRLLRPGGFLVVGELTSTDLLFSGMTVGTLPGWWIGAENGRPWGPLFTLSQWDTSLRNTGFGGIDTVTPDTSATLFCTAPEGPIKKCQLCFDDFVG